MKVEAHIVVRDAGEATHWYARAFGAQEISRIPLPDGRLLTVVMRFGESEIHIASEFPELGILSPSWIGGTATVLQLSTNDADTLWSRALAAGATPRGELKDAFWGERHGQLSDPFGHRWNIGQRIRDVPQDELVGAAAKLFGLTTQETNPGLAHGETRSTSSTTR